jgi:hypothetical protein
MDSSEGAVGPSSEVLFHIIKKWGYKPSPSKPQMASDKPLAIPNL